MAKPALEPLSVFVGAAEAKIVSLSDETDYGHVELELAGEFESMSAWLHVDQAREISEWLRRWLDKQGAAP